MTQEKQMEVNKKEASIDAVSREKYKRKEKSYRMLGAIFTQ